MSDKLKCIERPDEIDGAPCPASARPVAALRPGDYRSRAERMAENERDFFEVFRASRRTPAIIGRTDP